MKNFSNLNEFLSTATNPILIYTEPYGDPIYSIYRDNTLIDYDEGEPIPLGVVIGAYSENARFDIDGWFKDFDDRYPAY